MNKTSRTDEPLAGEGFNQSPNPLSADLTKNQDLKGRANARQLRNEDQRARNASSQTLEDNLVATSTTPEDHTVTGDLADDAVVIGHVDDNGVETQETFAAPSEGSIPPDRRSGRWNLSSMTRVKRNLFTFAKFVGPGFMVAVAYIDPGNYATDIVAGASYRFSLLFIVLVSNLFAILLQSLAIKLGTVTGLDLSSACRAFLPRWLNYALYGLAEIAIIATDIAEVIGTAIGLNLLIPQLPLVAGCALSILDVMLILLFYNPTGTMRGLRLFEFFVCVLVLAVAVCFCVQLSLIQNTSAGEVLKGYLPSSAIIEQEGLYQACGILGATVMPHSLFLGSGIVQPRLREYDAKRGLLPVGPGSASSSTNEGVDKVHYIPSQAAVKHSLKYSILELTLSLFIFAMFVNSAILIVAGASLYNNPEAINADIFAIHDLLSRSISPAAGTIFALALLLSGVSAGVVCTIAGQMVSEGALNWRVKPWIRRLVTRLISITPSIIIAGAVGKSGLNAALTGTQVVLSSVLPFVTAPLIYFTCLNRYMTVRPGMARFHVEADEGRVFSFRHATAETEGETKMANSWWLAIISVVVWLIIAIMNVANLVLLGMGQG